MKFVLQLTILVTVVVVTQARSTTLYNPQRQAPKTHKLSRMDSDVPTSYMETTRLDCHSAGFSPTGEDYSLTSPLPLRMRGGSKTEVTRIELSVGQETTLRIDLRVPKLSRTPEDC
eukprot:3727898-Rhodomonas_salina.4